MSATTTTLSPDIRNIYCIGRNYRLHAAEMGNEVPSSPMLFTKPTHAAVSMTNGTLVVPGAQGSVHYEAELVLAVGRTYEAGISCDELLSAFTVGLDLTLRDVQDRLKAKGHPWLAAKGFRNSAPLGRWLSFPGVPAITEHDFGLRINDKEVQRGNAKDMVFGLQQIVDFVGLTYGLAEGDLLYTGTPEGVGSLNEGDTLEVWWHEESLGKGQVRLSL
ncbi:fumarylacetoacetate hydrolase family protein [Cohnella silvisoli]|uniref:Fumarylacetoacetate hydrolase family protein n=1 Tax=Cohnella silvisoli TaxID=2873699 RepID=A0ABV1KW34_9BACL|nr:fumarylacetoacetate hydrolase family protein [Cohnella silvisoli]MCD9023133.1 fumarylacetoacetate hydrolase family protein [Cohnella silvisoli]